MDEIDPVAASITPEQKTAIVSSSSTYDPTAPEDPIARSVHQGPQEYAERTVKAGLMVNRPWEETAKLLQERGLNPKAVEGQYKLQMAKQARGQEEDNESVAGATLRQFARTSIPGYSGVQGFRDQKHYQEALGRVKEGNATDDDYKEVAHFQSIQEGNQRGQEYLNNRFGEGGGQFAGAGLHFLGAAPAMLGEGYAAGAVLGRVPGAAGRVLGAAPEGASYARQFGGFAARQAVATPLMPSLYAEQWAQNNVKQGRDVMNFRGLGTAGLQAYTQNLVLGTMQSKMGESYSTAARVLMKGEAGIAESAFGDLALSGMDYLLEPLHMETGTKGGLVGKLVRGEFGEASQQAAQQMFAFTLFAGLHELQGKPSPTKDALKEAIDGYKTDTEKMVESKSEELIHKGYSPPTAADLASKMTAGAMTRITAELKDDPTAEVFLSRFRPDDLADPHMGPLIKKFADDIKAKESKGTTEGTVAPAPEPPKPDVPSVVPSDAGKADTIVPLGPAEVPPKAPEPPVVAPPSPVTEAPPTPETARPGSSGSEKPAAPAPEPAKSSLSLSQTRQSRTHTGELKNTHEILDSSGRSLGTVSIVPRNDGKTLHIDWTGLAGAASGESSGKLGAASTRELIRKVAETYPNAEIAMGIRAGGAHKGQTRGVELDKFRPAKPSAPASRPTPESTPEPTPEVQNPHGEAFESEPLIPGKRPAWATEHPELGAVLNVVERSGGKEREFMTNSLENAGLIRVNETTGKPEGYETDRVEDDGIKQVRQSLIGGLTSAYRDLPVGHDRELVTEALKAAGAEQIGSRGERTGFNGAVHTGIPGRFSGSPVDVVRPGWMIPNHDALGSHRVILKAEVSKPHREALKSEVPPEPAPEAPKPVAPPAKIGEDPRLAAMRDRKKAAGEHADITNQVRSTQEMQDAERDAKESGAEGHEVAEATNDGVQRGTQSGIEEGVQRSHDVISRGETGRSGHEEETVSQAPNHPQTPAGRTPGQRSAKPIDADAASAGHWNDVLKIPDFDSDMWEATPPHIQQMILDAVPAFAKAIKRVGIATALARIQEKHAGGSKAIQPEDIPAPANIESAIDNSGEREQVKAGIRVLARGGGGAAAEKASGLSKQAINKAAARVFKGESLWEMVKDAADARLEALKEKAYAESTKNSMGEVETEVATNKPGKASTEEEPRIDEDTAARLLRDVEERNAKTSPVGYAPGDPIPGVTKGAHASDPATAKAIEDGIVRKGITAMPADAGGIPAAPGGDPTGRVAAGVEATWRGFTANVLSLAQKIAVRISRLWPELGNRVARYGSTGEHARRASDYYKDEILGPLADQAKGEYAKDYPGSKLSDEQAAIRAKKTSKRYMAAMYEERFRRTRAAFQESAAKADTRVSTATTEEAKDKARTESAAARKGAREVRSMIEVEGTDLRNEKDFQDTLAEAGYKAFGERWKPFSDKMDQLFKEATGADMDAPEDSSSQLPGRIFHAKRIQEGEVLDDKHIFFNPGARGNLSNPMMRKLGSSYKSTGSWEGYDIDPGRVIDYTIAQRLPHATKAMMIRQAVQDGAAMRVRPGQEDIPKGWREIPNVFKPWSTGAPEGSAKQTSLYAHPEAYKELRQVLQVDERPGALPGTQTTSALSLFSLTEATTHIRNLGTLIFKPGVNVIQFAKNIWGVMKGHAGVQRRLMDLAEIGALKPKGLESQLPSEGTLWGGWTDPTKAMSWLSKNTLGKAIDVMDNAVRLTLDDAFTNLVSRKGGGILAGGTDIQNTEQNRRDFINQVGNYQKQTQHAVVAWLRDTGIGPFATAGTAMTVGGVKAVLGRAGVKTESAWAQAKLTGEYYSKLIGTFSLAMLANYMLWKKVEGDDNTPFGAVKVSDGKKTGYIDLLALTGWNRGARTIGLQAAIEGNREAAHATRTQIADRAALTDIPHAIIHPAVGPIVQTGWEAVTGRNTAGMPLHEKVKNGNSELLANLQAALSNANPVVAVTTGSDRAKDDATAMEKGMKILGPFGFHYSKRPPGKPLPPH